jgi:signal transduction histidine kinase
MEQVFANIIYNAVIHTPPETTISITASVEEAAVAIIVHDNGPGLNVDDIPHLFEKFRRGSKAVSGGTGLGLSICKGIVEAHGGTISAANNPKGGASFTIRLPLNDPQKTSREDAI